MKAVVKLEKGASKIEYREWEKPVPGPGQVLLKVKAVGICGTDIHILHDRFPTTPPLILGHEFSGEVAAIGSGVSGWKIGDRVVAENITGACGSCDLCRTGHAHLCPQKKAYGSRSHGAMADWTVMPAHALHRIPDGVSHEEAAVVEPLAIATHAVLQRGNVRLDQKVVIIGPGPIGLLAILVAKSAGANVAMVGTSEDNARLAKARELGADLVLEAGPNISSLLNSWKPDRAIHCVVELSGSSSGIQHAIQWVGRGQCIAAVGLAGKEVLVPWDEAVVKGVDIRFCFSSSYQAWEQALALLASRQVSPASIITHRFPLPQWREAFDAVEKKEAIKCLLIP